MTCGESEPLICPTAATLRVTIVEFVLKDRNRGDKNQKINKGKQTKRD